MSNIIGMAERKSRLQGTRAKGFFNIWASYKLTGSVSQGKVANCAWLVAKVS